MSYYEIDGGWGTIFNCSPNVSNLPILGFLYDGYWLESSVDDYVIQLTNTVCAFCISDSGDEELAILGDALMNHYYVIFDHESDQVGFAPLVSSPTMKAAVATGSTPDTSYADANLTELSETVKIVIIVLLVLILVIVPGVFVYLVYCRKKPEAPSSDTTTAPANSDTTTSSTSEVT